LTLLREPVPERKSRTARKLAVVAITVRAAPMRMTVIIATPLSFLPNRLIPCSSSGRST
jgi:hypothetical protein